jgi:hypothetical protein
MTQVVSAQSVPRKIFFAGSLEPQSYQRLKQFRKTLFSVVSLALCEAWFLFSQKFGELLHI